MLSPRALSDSTGVFHRRFVCCFVDVLMHCRHKRGLYSSRLDYSMPRLEAQAVLTAQMNMINQAMVISSLLGAEARASFTAAQCYREQSPCLVTSGARKGLTAQRHVSLCLQ
jgi:hypothetical protein